MENQEFIAQVVAVIKAMGGMPVMLKISSVIMLIVASMKVSVLSPVWAKLGKAQIWVAPVLGLLAGLLDVAGGGEMSLAKALAYVAAGAGAIHLHEILDLIKKIPGLGAVYISAIDIIASFLGKKDA